MQKRKRIPRNGKFNVQKMKGCDDAVIYLVKQELKKEQQSKDIQEQILTKNIKKVRLKEKMTEIQDQRDEAEREKAFKELKIQR